MPKYEVFAVRLTDENVPQIVKEARKYDWTLEYLQDNMEFDAEDGWNTILYMKMFDSSAIATFNDEAENPQYPRIRLTDETDPLFGIFHKFEKI